MSLLPAEPGVRDSVLFVPYMSVNHHNGPFTETQQLI